MAKEGQERPKEGQKYINPVSIRVTPKVRGEIDKILELEDVTLQEVIRSLLKKGIEQYYFEQKLKDAAQNRAISEAKKGDSGYAVGE